MTCDKVREKGIIIIISQGKKDVMVVNGQVIQAIR